MRTLPKTFSGLPFRAIVVAHNDRGGCNLCIGAEGYNEDSYVVLSCTEAERELFPVGTKFDLVCVEEAREPARPACSIKITLSCGKCKNSSTHFFFSSALMHEHVARYVTLHEGCAVNEASRSFDQLVHAAGRAIQAEAERTRLKCDELARNVFALAGCDPSDPMVLKHATAWIAQAVDLLGSVEAVANLADFVDPEGERQAELLGSRPTP